MTYHWNISNYFPEGEGDAERGNGEQARRRGLPVRAGVPHPSPGQSRRRGQEGTDIQNIIIQAFFFVCYCGINYAFFGGWGADSRKYEKLMRRRKKGKIS